MRNKSAETPIQIAINAMRDEDGVNGKRLTLEQIANKYFGNDKNKAVYAISAARRYVRAFGDKNNSWHQRNKKV